MISRKKSEFIVNLERTSKFKANREIPSEFKVYLRKRKRVDSEFAQ